jgi:hypothetical protein
MYAVIRQYEFDRGSSEEITRKLRDVFVPLLKKAPDFVTYYWLDTGEGAGASISVFQSKAGAEESVRVAAAFVKEHLTGMSFSSPRITQGEVQAHG